VVADRPNLAPAARVIVTTQSAWESLAAVNDGFVPTSSADRAHPVYGNWPAQGTQWVQYSWSAAVSVRRVAAYRFDDNQGSDPAGSWLMSRGRAVFMKTHNPSVLGFGGQVAYVESINNQNAYSVAVSPGSFTEQPAQRWQAPSHWRSVHTSGSVRIDQTKFHHREQSPGDQPVDHHQRRRGHHPAAAGDLAVRDQRQRQRAARSGRYVDNPGDPANWSNSYTQYISAAAWKAYQAAPG
jgi:hypothetical protein